MHCGANGHNTCLTERGFKASQHRGGVQNSQQRPRGEEAGKVPPSPPPSAPVLWSLWGGVVPRLCHQHCVGLVQLQPTDKCAKHLQGSGHPHCGPTGATVRYVSCVAQISSVPVGNCLLLLFRVSSFLLDLSAIDTFLQGPGVLTLRIWK